MGRADARALPARDASGPRITSPPPFGCPPWYPRARRMTKVNQRDALNALTRERLTTLVRRFSLKVSARTRKNELVNVLAQSARANYETILGELSWDELKRICRKTRLIDTGKKEELVARGWLLAR